MNNASMNFQMYIKGINKKIALIADKIHPIIVNIL